jgi:hypothetical protein
MQEQQQESVPEAILRRLQQMMVQCQVMQLVPRQKQSVKLVPGQQQEMVPGQQQETVLGQPQ